MLQKLQSRRAGFTLVEIMIVVAIIALLAAIAVPNFLRARKRSQATRVLEDLRLIDAAVDQYAIETNRTTGYQVQWDDVKRYLKVGSKLYNSAHQDILGGDFGATFSVDTLPSVPGTTNTSLSDVAPAEFWSPFLVP
jgi:prepilin-type N-terminal cleavage/methylation domain-containing protein